MSDYYNVDLISGLQKYLDEHDVTLREGHTGQISDQTALLRQLSNSSEKGMNVMEIGFNCGHSSETFLLANKNNNVVSFDIGIYDYVRLGKKYIDYTFPNRHQLVIGNSLKTVPQFSESNNHIKFDLIFIDGHHGFHYAYNDIINCKALAHSKTILIVDDVVDEKTKYKHEHWTIGPTKAWRELISKNFIHEIGSKTYSDGRGVSLGMYHFI
tara:strand:- start:316 stop:951 length:636 start_codon:yes stop_codon:yes gene_type:complete